MSKPHVKFTGEAHPDFYKILRQRVNTHFKENGISKYANGNMIFKTAFMLGLYFIPLILMTTGLVQTLWPVMLMWTIMGFGMSGIGLSIMHDANHGAYSKNPKVNASLGFLLNVIGGYHINWKIQHNVLHHTYTNVDGHDEDIAKPIMRFSPNQKRKGIFMFQVLYAPFLYGLMTIYWLISKDIEQIVRYNRSGLLKNQGLSFRRALVTVLFNKAWYVGLFIALPLITVDILWWQSLLGFLLMHFICGMILALIFQPAHVVTQTNFYEPNASGNVENNWAVHQLMTTSNYANNSTIFSWFVGGLNHQIEHHLFPHICHVHYKSISSIVEKTAKEFNLPYYQYKTFLGAIISHFTLLNDLGTGRYDRRLAREQVI